MMRRLSSFRLVAGAIVVLVAGLPCFGAEVAVLKNGFSIRHERRQVLGNVTRLYVNADGSSYVDVASAEIEHFEADPTLRITPAFVNSRATATKGSPFFPAGRRRQTTALDLQPAVDLNQVVSEASARYRLDPDFVSSVIKAESGFNVRAVSPKGAQGLMQLMPGTASQLGVSNTFDPQANVEGGTKYLRELLERYNFDLAKALAAYNAGPQRVERFGGVPPYYETRRYVARVVKDFNKKKLAQGKTAARSSTAGSNPLASAKTPKGRLSSPAPSKTRVETKPIAQAKASVIPPHN